MFSRIELTRFPCATLGPFLLLGWLPLLTGLVAAALLVTPAFWPALGLATGLLWLRHRDQALLSTGRSVRRLIWQSGALTVEQSDGRSWNARVDDSSRLFSRWALLKLRPVDTISLNDRLQYRTVVLVHAGCIRNVDGTAFRRLRVVLHLSPPDDNLPDQKEGRPI
ncbi:hypothetical protein C8D92_101178 [Tamilnaduibacter salinus]|uniref:Toxin CptA n=1 Tax=Tamilnaduibacter salinus TaxID=1484056 RepID=A0A2A2I7C7_9GAMM|nr:hypothetical protein [Tamilnaduibacter salinus]PAV27194.1 hypothetical protein CF392_01705 [Tamilnaduibacter salinus]PVY78972.1 hypothetical protein C8D92_101178 [Tamilnaduibacter salinus]